MLENLPYGATAGFVDFPFGLRTPLTIEVVVLSLYEQDQWTACMLGSFTLN